MSRFTPLDIFVNETTGRAGIAPAPSPLAVKSPLPSTGSETTPRVFTLALDVAETVGKVIQIPGSVISAPWATDSTVVVGLVYHDVNRHEPIKIGKNFFQAGFRFNQFVLTWAAQAGKSIQFEVIDDRSPDQFVRVM